MKIYTISLAGALLAATFLSPALAADIQSTSKIDAVTVFPRGAQVTRFVQIDVPSGEHTIILKDLPADVVPGSLRVEGDVDGALAITSVDSKRVYIDEGASTSETRKRIEGEIEALNDQLRVLGDQVSAAHFRKKLVQRIPNRYLKAPNPRKDEQAAPEPDWTSLLQLISSQMAEIDTEIQGFQVAQRDIHKRSRNCTKSLSHKRLRASSVLKLPFT
ncbi:MAG: DUF4140 domain-containing protein [Hyphomicrobiales bacterium]